MKKLAIVAALMLCAPLVRGADTYLYKAIFVQAAPGKLLEFIQLYKDRLPVYDASGDARPFWMRHSQGDKWDVMFLFPLGSWSEYYSAARIAKREQAATKAALPQEEFARRFYNLTAWHEDLFVEGPPLDVVKKALDGAGFFHVEIFIALPGKQSELRKEREMENAYLEQVGRKTNLIFTHDQGAAWDLFTIGFYRNLKHYAESADVPPEKMDAAAKAAGFSAADQIGPYLRSLISTHHDTLAVAIK